MPVRTEIGTVYNCQQQLDQVILRLGIDDDVFRCADENRGDGDHELVFEGGRDNVEWRMDDSFERLNETMEMVVGDEEGEGEFVKEDEELELEEEREILAEKRGEEKIEEGIKRVPFVVDAILEVLD